MLGSVYRLGRESPEYQSGREQVLLQFLRQYIGGHYRFTTQYTRSLEAANHWHEHQRQNLERMSEGHERHVRDQAAYIKELEDVKAYFVKNLEEKEAATAQQEKTIREQADYIKQLLEAKEWLFKQLEQAQAELKRR